MAEYTNRYIEELTALHVIHRTDDWVEVRTTESIVFSFKPQIHEPMMEAGPFALETRDGLVTGVAIFGTWIMHKSDEDIERQNEEFAAARREELRATWERHRDSWRQREDALPDWIKPRLATFHERGGEAFEIEGWSYELIIAELAALYRESDGGDSPDVLEYASVHGTSGEQHQFAKVLAAASPDVSIGETISALTPLGANPFYEPDAS